jgi:putative membrane protein
VVAEWEVYAKEGSANLGRRWSTYAESEAKRTIELGPEQDDRDEKSGKTKFRSLVHTGEVTPTRPDYDPRLYMAAETTYLAWVRTGIALMGFGFVVARFGLFLREMTMVHPMPPQHYSFSMPIGVALISSGVIVNIVAGFRHARYVRALDRGDFPSAFGSTFAYLLGALLALIGLIMSIYLMRI